MAKPSSRMTKRPMVRAASLPVLAASATEAMPTTRSEKTRGMMVIRRPLSQTEPSASTIPAPSRSQGVPKACSPAPTTRPAISGTSTQVLKDRIIGYSSSVQGDWRQI